MFAMQRINLQNSKISTKITRKSHLVSQGSWNSPHVCNASIGLAKQQGFNENHSKISHSLLLKGELEQQAYLFVMQGVDIQNIYDSTKIIKNSPNCSGWFRISSPHVCHANNQLTKQQVFDENHSKISPRCSGEVRTTCTPVCHASNLL